VNNMTWEDILKQKKRLDMMGYNHADVFLKMRTEIFESVDKGVQEAIRLLYLYEKRDGFKQADRASQNLAREFTDEIKNSVEKWINDAMEGTNSFLEADFGLYSSDVEGEARQEAEAERRMGEERERSAEYSSKDY
tara:strand:+ start:2402 stop:2809 length:408 start_codon:yes stop_codon:yes gene_type:complete